MGELQQHILSLSVPERLQLISFIASSISEDAINGISQVPDEWVEEAMIRIQNAKAGNTKTYSWEEVKEQVNGRK
ncbi:MAG: addiction module protein [Bacteroidota bacterium]